ncbi:DEP domain-containing protein 7-like [Melanotaenia boesemani]|uniref:DEP domain-containing protein 7-like n=1 Tax=Melanotaenia boesemani TaxID=1250792 RepID=UPI001C04C01B|nr:DEP domain-containing protein 7-like [Melanotaenia boesemani]
MATIKERAAALNLAEKLCVRPHAPGVATKSAQSSSIWSSLIFHLRSTVTVKRRLVHLKSHDNCFLGSEAADVVADHITHAKECEGAVVSRDKVVHVCQALLECNVFEAVGTKMFGKNKKQGVFQDSKSALYRFVAVCTPSIDELERGVLASGIQTYFCCSSPNRLEKQTCPPEMAPPVKVCETSVLAGQLEARLSTNLSLEPLSGSLSPSRAQTDSVLPQSLVHQVWQEQTLHRLLNLVELPLLEEVLQCIQNPTSPPPANTVVHGNPDLIYSSNHLDRQILKAFRSSQEEEWLCAALDCLDFLPDQPVVELSRELPHCFPQEKTSDQELAGGSMQEEAHNGEQQTHLSQRGLAQCKLLLYGTLVKHYSHTNRSPLLPQHMTDIYMAITDLLVNAKLDRALEATQLCLKLLPLSSREELRRLLTFMSLAADPQGIKVDKEMENKLAVKKSFSRVILHSRAFTKEKEDLMLVFMLSNIKEIFKIPGALHKGVSDKLASLAQGKQPDVTGATLSQQVCSRTCAESVKKTTNQELWILLNSIHLDTKMSTKERKRRLRQFNQAHPQVFNQYFGDSAINEL